MAFDSLEQLVVATAEMVRPPERLTVAEAAEKYRWLNNPGSYIGPYLNSTTPYMVEPMETLTSLDHTAMIFVGPAQTSKTEAALNWVAYSSICDPADMMLIQTSQATARDFSKRRIERLFRHSTEVGKRVLPGSQNQNVFDVKFTSGMLLTLSWPTINELSGKPIGRLWLTDYDRMPDDVDHEGSPFDLARKRATTFGRFAMTVAESSPGREVDNPRWVRATPHEAPPTTGILSLYNRGDRRLWYWPCVSCGEPFEPDFSLLRWPDTDDIAEAAEACYMGCPHCGQVYYHGGDPKTGTPGKAELNRMGRWVRDRQIWKPKTGEVLGDPVRSSIASYWLKGPAAAFADWKTLVERYLIAEREFEQTGSEEALKATVNTDQGLPYLPRASKMDRLPEELKSRAKDIGDQVVPPWVRFLIATIDIQKNRFVVQVQGFGPAPGNPEMFDMTIVDRFDIRKSERRDEDGERYWVNPGSHPEDWDLLIEQVIGKTYPLDDGSGRKMMIKAVGCDSGGREGVTVNAYNFWRKLRAEGLLEHARFHLIKGASTRTAPRAQITYPDSDRKDRKAGARGEVPVLQINPNTLKDQASKMLDREEPGGGYIHFPDWLPDWFYTELTAEVRTAKGWENPKARRNEAWDLIVYALAVCCTRQINIEKIDWEDPPSWAREFDENDLIFEDGEDKPFETQEKPGYDLEDLARKLS